MIFISTSHLRFHSVEGFSIRHNIENDIHKYVIQHDLGRNWSLYMSEFISQTIEKMSQRKVEKRITDNTVVFTVDKLKIIEK